LITNETDIDELKIQKLDRVSISKTENLKKVKILGIFGPSEVELAQSITLKYAQINLQTI
jgi:hypothetical protein